MSLSRFAPNSRVTAPETQEFYWRNHGYVAISIDDPRMPWDLKEQLKRFMTRQYGERKAEANHG